MDPLRRLAYHVLIRGVQDVQRGERFSDDETETLLCWASLAGISRGSLELTFERARRGEVVIGKIPGPGCDPSRETAEKWGLRPQPKPRGRLIAAA